MDMDESLNVFGEPLESCGSDPVTGFFRDGCCNTCKQDIGSHTVCVSLTDAFLEFSRRRGNDLTTPTPGLSNQYPWRCSAAMPSISASNAAGPRPLPGRGLTLPARAPWEGMRAP